MPPTHAKPERRKAQWRIDNESTAVSEPQSTAPRRVRLALFGSLFLALAGLAALSIDLPIARWFHDKNCPPLVMKAFSLAEVFGHAFGAAAILLAVWVLAPDRRQRFPRAAMAAYCAGLAAIAFKLVLARNRPLRAPLDLLTSAADTFGSWFPMFSTGFSWQSFPSGHTALAVGLALSLAWLFPRGRWLFAAFVVLVAMQRISSGSHYLSDTLWGAAIGLICGSAFLPGGWCSFPFDRFERHASS